MVGEFIPLTVNEVRRETPEAVSIFFDYPAAQREAFHYTPGQYITIRWNEAGKEYRRSYSISSVPDDPHIAITIK